ncbi:MAG: hypothetical protein WAS33_01380 [Candidatus Promineifilaceae bacterium]
MNVPIGNGQNQADKQSQAVRTVRPEYLGQGCDLGNGEQANEGRNQAQTQSLVAPHRQTEGLQIDEEGFTTVIVGKKDGNMAGSQYIQCIQAIHCFVMKESRW